MMALTASVLVSVMVVISLDLVASQYSYLAVFPRNIRPDAELVVPILFSTPVINEKVTLTLSRKVREGPITREDMYIEKTVSVNNGKKKVEIKHVIPANITWGSYLLNISAMGSVVFSNSSSVYGRPKAHAIFIQTDKKMYKHGDTVQYRVFMVNADLDLRAPAFTVEIFDPNGNKIEELANKDKLFGISGTHELSDPAPLGSWKITVKIPAYDETETFIFEVEEYVLPKFEVTVTLPPSGHVSDTELKGFVKASYTFGQPVKGTLILTASRQYGSSFFDLVGIRKEMPIDGTAEFTFSMKYLTRLTRYIQHDTILVHARVTEAITGISLEDEADIRFYQDSYSVTFYPNMPDNFKPGENLFKAVVKVAQQDGRPPLAPVVDLMVTVTYFTDATPAMTTPLENCTMCTLISPFKQGEVVVKKTSLHKLGAGGLATFYLNIPLTAATATIKAEYKDAAAWKDLRRFRTRGTHVLEAELLDGNIKKFKIGDVATFRIKASEKPGLVISFVIVSRGQIVESGILDLLNLQEGNIQLTITRSMAPSARFVAFYVKSTGEVLATGLNFVVEQPFQNKVAISFDKSSPQEPKTDVTLTVTAEPHSMVNILGVDRSVLLLASGNDITQQRVKDELGEFGDNPFFPRSGWFDTIPSWPIPADDPFDIFSNAQLYVITDGDLYKFDLYSLERQKAVMSKSSPAMGGMRMQSAAFSADSANGGMGGGAGPVGHVRKFFPETWLWDTKDAAGGGVATFQSKLPDTITEFVVSAFALDVKTGLGVAATTANITTFLQFFVKLQLPYDVVRNEIAIIQVNIFNYLDTSQDVTVKLTGSEKFVGIKGGNYGTDVEVAGDLIKCVTVNVNEVKPVFFSIKPKTIGSINLNVTATIPNRFDQVVQPLRVKAEGLEKEESVSTLIVLTQQVTSSNEVVPIKYPADLVQDSARIKVTIYGDLLGPSLTNLGKLVRLPSGCGEQNMVHFAPTVFVAEYMRTTVRLDNDIKLLERITRFLKIGYQRQLIYQRNDGSFSAFGNADDEGSLWLTAFVIKSFARAHNLGLIFIDAELVGKAVKFISDNQRQDGLMDNTGIVSHKVLQGQSASSIYALSSYVLIALHETERAVIVKPPNLQTLGNTIRTLTDGLKRHYESLTQAELKQVGEYELAIAAYALKLVHTHVPGRPGIHLTLLSELEKSNILVKDGNLPQFWNDTSKAISIEITSYALLMYSALKDKQSLDKSSSVVKWLVNQRNPNGGFLSTQDTVVALQALSAFAALTYTKDVNVDINVSTRTNNIESGQVTRSVTIQTQDVLQIVDFKNGEVDEVRIAANGTGTVLVGVHQFYNIKAESTQAYSLSAIVEGETTNKYTLKVCASFTVASASTSNMAIINVGAPSGFEPVKEMVEMVPLLKRLEMSSGRLILYFDEIPKTELCVYVPVQRIARVAYLKPASVLAYSYYDPSDERVLMEYSLKQRTLCETCIDCCSSDQECPVANTNANPNANPAV